MEREARILLTGASGMVGSAILKKLVSEGFTQIYTANSSKIDLRNQLQVHEWVKEIQPEIAILSAARVGGVLANSTYPATFAIDNLLMQTIILDELVKAKVKKIVFIGSSCIYPLNAELPLNPVSLMSGKLEPTNSWYATAKLAMISALDGVSKQYGIETTTLLPTNLFGPGDSFDLVNGHVIPSLLLRTHQAKIENQENVTIWGTGKPLREVLFVDDLASAVLKLLLTPRVASVVNVGSGHEQSIADIALEVANVIGFKGELRFDTTKPDGAFRKPLDSSYLLSLGWKPEVTFRNGLKTTYDWMLNNVEHLRTDSKIAGNNV